LKYPADDTHNIKHKLSQLLFVGGQQQRNKDVGSIWRLCMAPIVGILRPAGVARLLSTESGTKVMKRLTQRCG